jgi:squalene synthase HpnC
LVLHGQHSSDEGLTDDLARKSQNPLLIDYCDWRKGWKSPGDFRAVSGFSDSRKRAGIRSQSTLGDTEQMSGEGRKFLANGMSGRARTSLRIGKNRPVPVIFHHDRMPFLRPPKKVAPTLFAHDLELYGPQTLSTAGSIDRHAAEAYCRTLATSHYENFPMVSWLLPKGLHQHFYNVYSYCRWADDLGDEIGDPARSLELLAWWRGELDACYAGQFRHPVFIALKPTIDEFAIPREPFLDLISAFEQDQSVCEYGTFAQLRDYCRRSADPVGRLVLSLCRTSNEQNVAWSDSICTGLQLANFWQDVARDFAIGRIYLPREDYERFGYRREDFNEKTSNGPFLELMKFEVDRAGRFLKDGLPLVEQLPGQLQVDIDLFAHGGLRILERIESIGYRVWERRPKVTKSDAVKLLIGALWRKLWRRRSDRLTIGPRD